MNYSQIKEKVDQTIKDTAEKLTLIEREAWIQEAVKIYSKHRPRIVVKDITGDGTYDYSVSTHLAYWIKGFSMIKKIEYPADQRDPVYIDEDDFIIYEKEAGEYIRFLDDTPSATQTIRVIYTALHILSARGINGTFSFASSDKSMNRAAGSFISDCIFPGVRIITPSINNPGPFTVMTVAALKITFLESVATEIAAALGISIETNTVPESDQDALCNLAASLCSQALASFYAQTSDSTIGADSINYRTKSQEYQSRAKEQKRLYMDYLGLKEGDVAPASIVKNLDIDYPGGGDRLTHPKKWR